jgi:ABC-type nitrate/sulfonate/bicarbonate transport system substrate-binding protein
LADVTPVIINEKKLIAQDVHIELVPIANPQVAMQKFDAGELDAIAGMPLETIFQRMAKQGDPGFKAYYFQVDVKGAGWVSIVANKSTEAKSVKDLAGKTVGSLPTDQAKYLLRRILKASGIPDNEIQIAEYNPATPLAGFVSNEQAAIFGLEPAISRAVSQGHRVLAAGPVSEFLYDGKSVPVSASVIRKDFIARHPETVKQFLEIVDQAVELQKNNPDEIRQYFTKRQYGELDPVVANHLFLPIMEKPSASLFPTLEQFINDLVTGQILKSRININALVN